MPGSLADVLVVGAGPVGLTMAAALTQHGLTCRVIDKAPAPSDKSKALVVWCRTLELLDGLGLAETFVLAGKKLSGGSMYAHGERVVHLALTSDESPYGFPLMIPQNETERLLTEHLAGLGVEIERQVELVTFGETADAVSCTLRHADGTDEAIQLPWVIGCDGAHSTVRHTLGLEFTGQAEPNDWMLADVRIAGSLAQDEVSVYWGEKGVMVFFPIRDDRFRVIADLGNATDRALRADVTLAEVQAKVDERGPAGLTLSDPIWLANFRINERKVSDYRKGRVMLAGDAAHIHSPAGGQGMNTGMQDAFNLAWKIALVHRGLGKMEPLLQSYSIERSAVGDQVLRNASRFTTLATLRSPVAQWLRNHIAPILSSFQAVQDKIRNDWFELSINYRHSPLSVDAWPLFKGGLAAGDRLCDAPLTAADGHVTTLFSVIRGTRHTLLLLTGTAGHQEVSQLMESTKDARQAFSQVLASHLIVKDPIDSATATELPGSSIYFDSTGSVHERLGARAPTLLVIRPDGYIGYRCQPADGTKLREYLDAYLLPNHA